MDTPENRERIESDLAEHSHDDTDVDDAERFALQQSRYLSALLSGELNDQIRLFWINARKTASERMGVDDQGRIEHGKLHKLRKSTEGSAFLLVAEARVQVVAASIPFTTSDGHRLRAIFSEVPPGLFTVPYFQLVEVVPDHDSPEEYLSWRFEEPERERVIAGAQASALFVTSFVPYLADAVDGYDFFYNGETTGTERVLIAGSLGVNLLSAGVAPNASPTLRSAKALVRYLRGAGRSSDEIAQVMARVARSNGEDVPGFLAKLDLDQLDEIGALAHNAVRVGGAASEVLSARHLRLLDEGIGFETFKDLKDHLGPPPTGHAWHHIVGQNADNISRFGPEYIHNTANVIAIPHGKGSVHLAQIEAFLNSSRPEITGHGFKRVRDWLKTKSYQFQYEYGVILLRNNGIPLP